MTKTLSELQIESAEEDRSFGLWMLVWMTGIFIVIFGFALYGFLHFMGEVK